MKGKQNEFTRGVILSILEGLKEEGFHFYKYDIDDLRSVATPWMVNRDVNHEHIFSAIRKVLEKNWRITIVKQRVVLERLILEGKRKDFILQITVYTNREGEIHL